MPSGHNSGIYFSPLMERLEKAWRARGFESHEQCRNFLEAASRNGAGGVHDVSGMAVYLGVSERWLMRDEGSFLLDPQKTWYEKFRAYLPDNISPSFVPQKSRPQNLATIIHNGPQDLMSILQPEEAIDNPQKSATVIRDINNLPWLRDELRRLYVGSDYPVPLRHAAFAGWILTNHHSMGAVSQAHIDRAVETLRRHEDRDQLKFAVSDAAPPYAMIQAYSHATLLCARVIQAVAADHNLEAPDLSRRPVAGWHERVRHKQGPSFT